MRPTKSNLYRIAGTLLLCFIMSLTYTAFARVGGAGGHGGGHSGGGHGYSGGGHYYGGGGYGGGGGGGISPLVIIVIVIIVVIYLYGKRKVNNIEATTLAPSTVSFPEGLDAQKVAGSFMAIQDAWQRQDLSNVRKWLSDGMYQRMTTQFKMMDVLGQRNTLSDIRINGIVAAGTLIDGNYYTAEAAISFRMNDSFTSSKYPAFNESFPDDAAIEYWTFIKRKDSDNEKNLYDNNNCPNCGAPFEVKMGEISRCSNCNTLTNSAAYDWVLSEITQEEEYSGGAGFAKDPMLKDLMKTDPFFAVQRMEDIASNIFMQVMEVLTGDDKKKLTRFADDATTHAIMQIKQNTPPFVFDRLYLNNVTLSNYTVEDNVVKLFFDINATYRRFATGAKLQMMDNDFVTSGCSLVLSRNKDVTAKATTGETVYSHECSTCGAPFIDTTEDKCTYCDSPVVDKQKNWVLTGFAWV
ncbi:MAG: hypothetical protein JWQ38_2441 [Flavipsychrobacter sp.]|nr:hypothetical protein [Flavipsychrobacter sp.]